MEDKSEVEKSVCGIIMPISATEPYPLTHWIEVQQIIESAIEDAGFKPNIVSDADDVGIIHNRIVTNLAENAIVVCDISSKNPNVMFELGLRLAFDKATIIIKDEKTPYNFDTSPIEHLNYPSDLNYHRIAEFKQILKNKILDTFEASKDPSYSTFLKHFKNYKRELHSEKLNDNEYIIKQFDKLFDRIDRLETINAKHIRQDLIDNIESGYSSYYIRETLRPIYEFYKKSLSATEFNKLSGFDSRYNGFYNYLTDKNPETISKFTKIGIDQAIRKLLEND